MGHLYFVRHGQTIWNVENKICGATDIALTDLGHEQAIETGKRILEQNIKADMILYSPLVRAKDTALHISEITGIPAKMEMRLKEQNFGIYESTARNGAEFGEAKKQFITKYGTGESMLHLAQRIYNLLDDIKESDKTYILVAHNGIARVVQSYFNEMTNDEYAKFGVDNCTVIEYSWEEKAICPCCGKKSLPLVDNKYDICPICNWENDPYQSMNPEETGANNISLSQAQKLFNTKL